MEEKDQILIEKYLTGELSELEIESFNKRMAEDLPFNSDVQLSKLSLTSLRLAKREELKAHFSQRDKINTVNFSKYIIGLLVVIVLVSVLWFWTNKKSQPEIINYFDLKVDTTLIKTDKEILKDSIINPLNLNSKNKIVPKIRKQDIAKKPESGEELYAMHYTPYKDESLSIFMRGKNEIVSYSKFMQSYVASNYNETLSSFDSLSVLLQKNDNVLFIKANALMALSQIDEAQVLFSSIVDRNQSKHINASKWYLAMCYLKKNKIEQAKELFKEVESKNTQEILNQLSQIPNGVK